jgi:hypothetical protein
MTCPCAFRLWLSRIDPSSVGQQGTSDDSLFPCFLFVSRLLDRYNIGNKSSRAFAVCRIGNEKRFRKDIDPMNELQRLLFIPSSGSPETDRRGFLLATTAGLGALLAGPEPVRADGILTGSIAIENDYRGDVAIRLYHAQALDRIFGTWQLKGSTTSHLDFANEPLVIGGDWELDIKFGNGVTSVKRVVNEIGDHKDGRWTVRASRIMDGRIPEPDVAIEGGTDAQQKLLKDAVALMCRRVCDLRVRAAYRSCKPDWLIRGEYLKRVNLLEYSEEFDNSRVDSYLEYQWYYLAEYGCPKLTINVKKLPANIAGQAFVGMVQVEYGARARKDIRGEFNIDVNGSLVGGAGRASSSEFWAGVIAHEMLHNLGHMHHPGEYSFAYQINAFSFAVANERKVLDRKDKLDFE